jgi:hypothetical protein
MNQEIEACSLPDAPTKGLAATSTIEGSSFSGVLTRVESGQLQMGSAENTASVLASQPA